MYRMAFPERRISPSFALHISVHPSQPGNTRGRDSPMLLGLAKCGQEKGGLPVRSIAEYECPCNFPIKTHSHEAALERSALNVTGHT